MTQRRHPTLDLPGSELMELRLLRNATLKLNVAGRTVLIDPFFAPKHSRPSFTGRSPNPLVELPFSINDILENVEIVVVSHLHSDHFDSVAQSEIPKYLPVICQPGDEARISSTGFQHVTPLLDAIDWHGIKFTRREGRHGFGQVVEKMGSVMGFSIEAKDEPSVYWTGDTVLYPAVEEIIRTTDPNVIVIHPCGALWEGDPIAMDAEQAITVCKASPRATVVATHLEALDHTTVSRDDLRRQSTLQGIASEQLRIPQDGECLEFWVR
jgi:L-ascorbate metabolism protein UlaG (beta-lactamase superfamily)